MVVKHLEDIDGLLDFYSSGSNNQVDWLIRTEYELKKIALNATDERNVLSEMTRSVQEKKNRLSCIIQEYNTPYLLQSLNEGIISCRTN